MDLGLQGKVALVAGASQGIGLATALTFAREGAKVAMCARGEATLNEAAEMIRRQTGAEVLPLVADMSKAEDIQKFVAASAGHFSRLDIIVNNAGGPPPGEFMKFSDEDWDRAYQLSFMCYQFESWWGMFAPARIPKGVVTKMNDEVRRILNFADVKEVLEKQGAEPMNMTAEAFASFVRAETDKMGKLVKISGARIE